MEENEKLFTDVNNYTKYKLVEMLIKRMNDGRLNLDNMNAIEDVADDVLKVLAIAGMKFYGELKGEFDE